MILVEKEKRIDPPGWTRACLPNVDGQRTSKTRSSGLSKMAGRRYKKRISLRNGRLGQIGFNGPFQVVTVGFQNRNTCFVAGVGDRFHSRQNVLFQLFATDGRFDHIPLQGTFFALGQDLVL
jgi:hypothetical protein